jgi:hypothetical protein
MRFPLIKAALPSSVPGFAAAAACALSQKIPRRSAAHLPALMGYSFPRDSLWPRAQVRDNRRQDEIAYHRARACTGLRLHRGRRSQEECSSPGGKIAQGEAGQEVRQGPAREEGVPRRGEAPLAAGAACPCTIRGILACCVESHLDISSLNAKSNCGCATATAEPSPGRAARPAPTPHRGRTPDRPAGAAARPVWYCPGPAPRGRSGR